MDKRSEHIGWLSRFCVPMWLNAREVVHKGGMSCLVIVSLH